MSKLDRKWYVYIPPIVTIRSSDFPCSTIVSLKSDGQHLWVGPVSSWHILRLDKLKGEWENLTPMAYHNWSGWLTGADYSVTAIEVDKNYVWLGTERKGLRRYDKSNKRWESFHATYCPFWGLSGKPENIPANCGLRDNRIHCLAIDDDYLYVGAGGGLCAYSKKDGSWIVIKAVSHETDLYSAGYIPGRDDITTVAVDEDSIWCGTRRNGLIRYLKPHVLLAGDEGKEQE